MHTEEPPGHERTADQPATQGPELIRRPMLRAYILLNAESYTVLSRYFELTIEEHDAAALDCLDLIDIGDPETSGPAALALRTDEERRYDTLRSDHFVANVIQKGRVSTFPLAETRRLAAALGVTEEERPCLVFAPPAVSERVGIYCFPRDVYRLNGAEYAFDRGFKRWLWRPDVRELCVANLDVDGYRAQLPPLLDELASDVDRELADARARTMCECGIVDPRDRGRPGDGPEDVAVFEFRRDGDVWRVAYAGVEHPAVAGSLVGMARIHYLLSRPHRGVPAEEVIRATPRRRHNAKAPPRPGLTNALLAADGLGIAQVVSEDAPAIDPKTIRQVRERLKLLRSRAGTLEAGASLEDLSELQAECVQLESYLGATTDQRGRPRKDGGSAAKAASTLLHSFQRAYSRLRHPVSELEAHLLAHLHTGRECRYDPPTPIPWQL